MSRNHLLVLLVLGTIAFSYWMGREAADRATPPQPGMVLAPPAPVSEPAPPPTTRKGTTWGVNATVETPAGVALLSCHGEPATDEGGCNFAHGDTSCAKALPLLCLEQGESPLPTDLRAPPADAVLPGERDAGWVGGRVATTAPVMGTALKTRAAADARCASELGSGWRAADVDAGIPDRNPGARPLPDADGVARPGHSAEAFYAAGDPIRTSRFWVASEAPAANCWD